MQGKYRADNAPGGFIGRIYGEMRISEIQNLWILRKLLQKPTGYDLGQ